MDSQKYIGMVLAAAAVVVVLVVLTRERTSYELANGTSAKVRNEASANGDQLDSKSPRPPAKPKGSGPEVPAWMAEFKKLVGSERVPDVRPLTEEIISRWEIPDPESMEPAERRLLHRMMLTVGDSVHLDATARFSFITERVPASWWRTTVDDMLRFLSAEDLDRVIAQIDKLPAGAPRTELYRLSLQRKTRLGIPHEEIAAWIATLEHEEERELYP